MMLNADRPYYRIILTLFSTALITSLLTGTRLLAIGAPIAGLTAEFIADIGYVKGFIRMRQVNETGKL